MARQIRPVFVACAVIVVLTVGFVCWQASRSIPPDAEDTARPTDAPTGGSGAHEVASPSGDDRTDLAPRAEPPPEPLASSEPAPEPLRSDALGTVGAVVHVSARIVDADGSPLPGARAIWLPNTATLVAAGLSPDTWGTWMPSMQPPTPLERLSQALSDSDGRIALDTRLVPVDTEDEWYDDDPTMSVPALLVVHEGWATRVKSVGKPKDAACDFGDVVLVPEAVVAGRVVDESGRPLAGVRVRMLHQDVTPGTGGAELIWQAGCVPELMQRLSPGDGRVAFGGLWPGKTRFELWAPDRVRLVLKCEPVSGQTLDLGDLTVERGASVDGIVVDHAGQPIEGATVLIVDGEIQGGMMGDVGYGYEPGDDSLHDELLQAEGNGRHASVRTDATGAFRFEGLDAPAHSLYARADGFEPARLRPVAPGTTGARIELQPPAQLRITVVDRATRAPLADALVAVTRDSGVDSGRGDVSLAVEASGPGVFLARGAGPRAQRVAASAPGHAGVVVQAPGVIAPGSAEFTVELGPEAVLAGHVLDAQGQPRPGATIELRAPGQLRYPLLQVQADSSGAFRIERLGPVTVELVAFAPGSPDSAPLTIEIEEGQQLDHEVRLPAPARIAGTVLRPDGTPHAEARVQLDVPPFGEFKFMELSPRFEGWAQTDEQGRYAFEALGPGSYQVSVHGLPSVECSLVEGEQRTVDFAAAPTARVSGRVTSAGAAVSGVPVTASNDSPDRSQRLAWVKPAITDDSGRYELELKPVGEVEVYVDPRGSPESEHRLTTLAPGQEVVIDLELPAGRIAGRVVDDATGEPVAKLDVSLIAGEDLSIGYADTGDDGRFELRFLRPDTYRVHLLGHGAVAGRRRRAIVPPEPREIAVAPGAAVDDVVLRVCRGASLAGDVRLADGGHVKDGERVLLVRTSEGRIVPGVHHVWSSGGDLPPGMHLKSSPSSIFDDVSTEGGRYEFIALPAGEYRVLVGQAEAEQVLALGEPATLDEHERLELDLVAR